MVLVVIINLILKKNLPACINLSVGKRVNGVILVNKSFPMYIPITDDITSDQSPHGLYLFNTQDHVKPHEQILTDILQLLFISTSHRLPFVLCPN